MRNSLLLAAAACGLIAAAPAYAQQVIVQDRQAIAAGASADINCDAIALSTVYVGSVAGNTRGGAFQTSTEIGIFNKTWQLPGESALGLNVMASGINIGVSGTPALADTLGQLVASFSAASETLNLVSSNNADAPPLFSVTMKNAYGNAGVAASESGIASATEYQNAGSVTVSGSLIEPRVITAPVSPTPSPDPTKRTVIFDGGGVAVVANVVHQYDGGGDGFRMEDVVAVQVNFGGIPSLGSCYGSINMGYAGIDFPSL